MKKHLLLLCVLTLLCGCTLPGALNKDTVLREEKVVYESPLSGEAFLGERKETKLKDAEAQDSKLILTEEGKAELMRQQQDLYAFSTLEVTQQNLYAEILFALTGYVEEMEVSTLDTEEIDKIFQCVLMDHPEIFYADGYTFIKYTLGEEIKKITFTGTYLYSKEEKEQREVWLEEAAASILQGIPEGASDYEKVKYIYETIIRGTEYRLDSVDNQNICSVLLNKASVCQGYAKTAQYLLEQLGIPCTLVIGTVDNGEGHAWNLVRIDGEWYYMDATWGDAYYLFEEGGYGQLQGEISGINYDYLCVTTAQINRTHTLNPLVPLPECTATRDNYYVQEGAYFERADLEKLEQLIIRYREQGKEAVTLKCAASEVYEELIQKLIKEQMIFHYLEAENGSIMYTNSADQLSLTFWF